jgi:hypothetical protein
MWHELGHSVALFAQGDAEAVWVRPAPDNKAEVDLFTSDGAESGAADVVYAIAFGFAASSPHVARKILPMPASSVGGMFEMLLSGPQELTDSVAASPKDLAILKISEVPDELWHMALADGVAATLTPGADEWIARLQAEYRDRGIVTIMRDEITALMEGKIDR